MSDLDGFVPTITTQFKRDFNVDVEEGIYKAVCKLDAKVDKAELMKLLRGDRHSYDKGYKDGMRDAVPVVRCKNCEHYMTIHCVCDGCCISDDWFCASGKRKEEKDE